jgi:hypothetical protein
MNPKKLIPILTAIAASVAAPAMKAATYSDQDVLLIFRANGYNDVEYDLGSVSQFLGHSNGYQAVVTGWSADVVSGQFALDGGLAQFGLLAVTSDQDANPRAWLTDDQPLVSVTDVTQSKWEVGLYGIIEAIGVGIATDPDAPAGTNYDVVSPSSSYSFDFITSNRGQSAALIPFLGGGSGLKFGATAAVPGTVLFYEVDPSSAPTKPAGTLVGSFSLSAAGTLEFQAGPLLSAAPITSVSNSNGTSAVTFSSSRAVKYRLRYATQLGGSPQTWAILPTTVVGDGNPQTLQDNSASDSARYYVVESYQ